MDIVADFNLNLQSFYSRSKNIQKWIELHVSIYSRNYIIYSQKGGLFIAKIIYRPKKIFTRPKKFHGIEKKFVFLGQEKIV